MSELPGRSFGSHYRRVFVRGLPDRPRLSAPLDISHLESKCLQMYIWSTGFKEVKMHAWKDFHRYGMSDIIFSRDIKEPGGVVGGGVGVLGRHGRATHETRRVVVLHRLGVAEGLQDGVGL